MLCEGSAAASKKSNTFSLLCSASCLECEDPKLPARTQATVIYVKLSRFPLEAIATFKSNFQNKPKKRNV